ncbi:MAG: phosphoribosylglycinamide formyltransferase [Phycisphaerae bacterium]|mgnify:CR=1 FL=1|jgi:phosphoribosylglycinamide formyltransferase-1|nr:phosphoribosylglycinamide formyltransferase [Phycisphaerae bacterium]
MISDKNKKIKLAVLISGGGRSLLNMIERIDAGTLPASIELVISSRADAKGLQIAAQAGIATCVITAKGKSIDQFSEEITAELDRAKPELVCLAGFMCFYKIPDHYHGKVMNIHPALLPAFGGKGMYGHHVHEAVIAAGCKVTGCTVHFADNHYDQGPIIIQRAIPVQEDDTPDTLATRVFEEEKIAYPEAIELFAQGRLKIEGRRVRIVPKV